MNKKEKIKALKEQFKQRIAEGASHKTLEKELGIPRRTAFEWAFGRSASSNPGKKYKKKSIEAVIENKAQDIAQEPEENIYDIKAREYYEAYNNYHENRFDEIEDPELQAYKTFVITTVQNDTPVNAHFYENLKFYCKRHGAKLLVLPVRYKMKSSSVFNVEQQHLYIRNAQINKNIKIMGLLNILPTIVSPLAGIDSISKGCSMIVPHNQLALKSLPTLEGHPAVMYTPGSLSLAKSCYPNDKTGQKALLNHSNSALVVSITDEEKFTIRVLNCDKTGGFSDIDGDYQYAGFKRRDYVEALVLGDEHAYVHDPEAKKAVFTNKDSIVNVLNPRQIVRHDIFDTFSGNHHEYDDHLLRAGKAMSGTNVLEKELMHFAQYLEETTYPNRKTVIVGSNHNEHLYKYISNTNNFRDVQNARVCHFLSYHLLDSMEHTPVGPSFDSPLKLWLENWKHGKDIKNIHFLGRVSSYKIMDVEVSMHGDVGANGSRGSPQAHSRLPVKTITGHTHTPSITLGNWTNGMLCYTKLGYNKGPSSWMQTVTVIYPNGKRQMIFILNGRWR